jgi:hypothetical protein
VATPQVDPRLQDPKRLLEKAPEHPAHPVHASQGLPGLGHPPLVQEEPSPLHLDRGVQEPLFVALPVHLFALHRRRERPCKQILGLGQVARGGRGPPLAQQHALGMPALVEEATEDLLPAVEPELLRLELDLEIEVRALPLDHHVGAQGGVGLPPAAPPLLPRRVVEGGLDRHHEPGIVHRDLRQLLADDVVPAALDLDHPVAEPVGRLLAGRAPHLPAALFGLLEAVRVEDLGQARAVDILVRERVHLGAGDPLDQVEEALGRERAKAGHLDDLLEDLGEVLLAQAPGEHVEDHRALRIDDRPVGAVGFAGGEARAQHDRPERFDGPAVVGRPGERLLPARGRAKGGTALPVEVLPPVEERSVVRHGLADPLVPVALPAHDVPPPLMGDLMRDHRPPILVAEVEVEPIEVGHHEVRQGHETEHRLGEVPGNRDHRQVIQRIGPEELLEIGKRLDYGLQDLLALVPAQHRLPPGIERQRHLHVPGLRRLEPIAADLEREGGDRHVQDPALPPHAPGLLPPVHPPAAGDQVVLAGPAEGHVIDGAVLGAGMGIPAQGVEQSDGAAVLLEQAARVLHHDLHRLVARGGRQDRRDLARGPHGHQDLPGPVRHPRNLQVGMELQGDGSAAADHRDQIEASPAAQAQVVRHRDLQGVLLRLERRPAVDGLPLLVPQRRGHPGVPLAQVLELQADEPPLPALAGELLQDLALLLLRGVQRDELPEGHLLLGRGLDGVQEVAELLTLQPGREVALRGRVPGGVGQQGAVHAEQPALRASFPASPHLLGPAEPLGLQAFGLRPAQHRIRRRIEPEDQGHLGERLVEPRPTGEKIELPRLDLVRRLQGDPPLAEKHHLHRPPPHPGCRHQDPLLEDDARQTGDEADVAQGDRPRRIEPDLPDLPLDAHQVGRGGKGRPGSQGEGEGEPYEKGAGGAKAKRHSRLLAGAGQGSPEL